MMRLKDSIGLYPFIAHHRPGGAQVWFILHTQDVSDKTRNTHQRNLAEPTRFRGEGALLHEGLMRVNTLQYSTHEVEIDTLG